MDERDYPAPFRKRFPNFRMQDFQPFVFNLVIAGELFDRELRIRPKFDFGGSKLDRPLDAQFRGRIFGDVVRSVAEVLVPTFHRITPFVGNENPAPCGSGVST